MAQRIRPEQEAQLRLYTIEWTDQGIDSFEQAYDWIAESSSYEKADEFHFELLERISELEEHPLLGPVVSELSGAQSASIESSISEFLQTKRQLVISRNHRVIYEVNEKEAIVYILLIHPTRLPLSQLIQEANE